MEAKSSTETVVLIPTRNRADLAVNAIQSVLQQPVDNLQVMVSDNSTAKADRSALAAFCEQLSDPRLLYLVPPRALPMSEHWDWAMGQALQRYDASHFIYLTDRSLFKPGELLNIARLARLHPDEVISYDWVTIFDHLWPIIVERQPQTGQLAELSASRLLFLSSRSIFPRCLPRMLNCCVPRSVIERIRERFGNVFASISPDYNFCYRCLEVVDSILYYDLAAFVSYAIPRSNGVSIIGTSTDATRDFDANLPLAVPRSFAAPVPAFKTGINYVVHEYCLVRQESASRKFQEVDVARYIAQNASEISRNENVDQKREMEVLLRTQGYRRSLAVRLASHTNVLLRTGVKRLLRRWPTIAKLVPRPTFKSVEDAISYAISIPPNGNLNAAHLDLLRR